MKIAVIANGDIQDYGFTQRIVKECEYIVACDGGLKHCQTMDIVPDCIIGDLDSTPPEILCKYEHIPLMRFPTDKDQTDLELVMAYVCTANDTKTASSIVILGALGGRFDHQLGNLYVLMHAMQYGKDVEIRDESTVVRVVNSHLKLHSKDGKVVSIFPLTEETMGIVTEGLQYPLQNEGLAFGTARGLSNRLEGTEGHITVKKGWLAVVQAIQP